MSEKAKIFLLLTGSALMTGLSVTFSKYFGIFEWISLAPMIIALNMICRAEKIKPGRVYLFGLFYFEILYAVCFHWFISLYPLDFTGLNNFYSVLVIITAWFGLPLLQALTGGLVFLIYFAISRTELAKKHAVVNVIALPCVYTFYEFTQTLGWWGVPWGRLSLGQSEALYHIQTASLFGSYFITATLLFVNSFIAFCILSCKTREKAKKMYAISALAVYSFNLIAGISLYYAEEKRITDSEKITVGVIQGNISSTEKWYTEKEGILDRHIRLTEESANAGADVVIWAETALPMSYKKGGTYCTQISELARKHGITILVGALEGSEALDRNAIICYHTDGTRDDVIYAKRHLVPFGEYVPMRSVIETCLPFLTEISILGEDWMPGDDSAIFNTGSGNIGSLLCFDSIYETLARDSVNDGAELLAISTNDSWFSDSAAIYMHNNQARMRAVENGRFVARSANTGMSSFITSNGKVISTIPALETGYLNCELTLLSHKTLFTTIGNAFVYLLGAAATIPFAYEAFLKIKARYSTDNANNSLQKGDYHE